MIINAIILYTYPTTNNNNNFLCINQTRLLTPSIRMMKF